MTRVLTAAGLVAAAWMAVSLTVCVLYSWVATTNRKRRYPDCPCAACQR